MHYSLITSGHQFVGPATLYSIVHCTVLLSILRVAYSFSLGDQSSVAMIKQTYCGGLITPKCCIH